MPTAASLKPDARFFGLFVGRSGSGKSAAAYSFPTPMKILDLDGRVRGGLVPWITNRENIEYEYFPPFVAKKEMLFTRLNESLDSLLVQANLGRLPYKTIVLDSITHETIGLLLDAIKLTHEKGKGRKIGTMDISSPEDYKYQSIGTHQVLAFLRSLNVPNVIVTAHIVNKYGKPEGKPGEEENKFAENIIVGEQLSLTDKLAENVPTSFDHVFRFQKRDIGHKIKFEFSAQGDLGRSAYDIPYGQHDITNKHFYNDVLKTYMVPTNNQTLPAVPAVS